MLTEIKGSHCMESGYFVGLQPYSSITRYKSNGEKCECKGYYCRVYSSVTSDFIGDFILAYGFEILDGINLCDAIQIHLKELIERTS